MRTLPALLVLTCWVLAAGIGNLLVPQLERVVETHSRSFMPADAPSSVATERSARHFSEASGDNLNYLVLERNSGLTGQDRAFYDSIVTRLRDDRQHVQAVTDLWGDPIAKVAAVSVDGNAAYVMLRLAGRLGTTEASAAVEQVRQTVARNTPPNGLRVYVTGPGATISDEFGAIDRQMLTITAATVALIMVLLLMVYRSPITAAIPLLSVGLALAVARPIVAAFGDAGLVEVSLFSVALLAAMMLGAGTDYGVFLIGRYQEGRRAGVPAPRALTAAYRGVAPVIVGSALTISVALAALGFAKVGMLRSAGMPSAIGILVAMLAALTLTPALLTLAARCGFVEPRGDGRIARRWRRVGVSVARWPAPILAAATGLVFVIALPVLGIRVGWDEPAATPEDAESNQGYAAMDRHFPANRLQPTVVTVVADHDLRNPAGLIAVERITGKLMEIPGVRMVQSASRPGGQVPDEATLTYQVGTIGRQLGDSVGALTQQLHRIGDLDDTLSAMRTVVGQLQRDLGRGETGFDQIGAAAGDMRTGMDGMRQNVVTVSGYLDPLRSFVNGVGDCAVNPICSAVQRVVTPVDELVRSSEALSTGAAKLTGGSDAAAAAFAEVPAALRTMGSALDRAGVATRDLNGLAATLGPQMRQLTDYLAELDSQFAGSASGGFYLPQRALTDPRFVTAMRSLMSGDGRATSLLVFGDGREWSGDGARRAVQIDQAVREATKEGTLVPVEVDLMGVGPATRDLQQLTARDLRLLVISTLTLIFLIVTAMLRSPVAGLVVVGTVAVSYASAMGAAVLIWQHLLGHDLHWAVPPIALIALVAVGADYNLLLSMRLREELGAGIKTGVIRAFAGTGGVVTTAGIVFGLTMIALVGSSVLSIAQIGSTIAVGLLVDTLVIRTFVVPSLAVLFGRWFWWPTMPLIPRAAANPAATRRAGSASPS